MEARARSVKQNMIANYFGQGWSALMGLIFLPLYIDYMGTESFALVGIFVMVQAWLVLLDMGMKPALTREMAFFSARSEGVEFVRDLLRSVEAVGLFLGAGIALAAWAASDWIATEWLTAENLSMSSVAGAIAWMGVVVGARFIESIYVSSIVGLQRQVAQNVLGSLLATLRGAGAVAVLALISPTITAFFVWQALVSLISIAAYASLVYRTLPAGVRTARFSPAALISIWRFAAGMLAISTLALLLTQVDKILLSSLLSLEAFAYYALAAMVATALRIIPSPITTAVYPRFTQMVSLRLDQASLTSLYHHSSQLVSVLMGSAAIVLMTFSDRILLLWTRDAVISQETAPLLTVLALGTLLNGLMWIPYQLQLAHGWTSLTIRINAVAVLILVPAILWVVPRFGAIGAAWAWVLLNCGYLVFNIYFMHRRLIVGEKWRWYGSDLALPLGAASAVALLCRWMMPDNINVTGEILAMAVTSCLTLMAATLAAPLIRHQVHRHIKAGLPVLKSTGTR